MPAEATPRAVAGVLLAAGMSTRMGCNKLLLEVSSEPSGRQPLVRQAARRALAAGLSPLLVVVGHEAGRVRAALAGLECSFVHNEEFASGIVSSVRTGIAAVPADVAAATVVLADMPHVSTAMLAELVATYRATQAPLVVSDYGGVRAPPVLYDRALFPELLAMVEGKCAQQVARRHQERAEILSWPPAALADLDLPDDYDRLRDAVAEVG